MPRKGTLRAEGASEDIKNGAVFRLRKVGEHQTENSPRRPVKSTYNTIIVICMNIGCVKACRVSMSIEVGISFTNENNINATTVSNEHSISGNAVNEWNKKFNEIMSVFDVEANAFPTNSGDVVT
jgi:hypothetical protein